MSDMGGADGTSLTMLDRARANDPEAWTRVVRLYQPLVAYWCSRGGIPSADIDDLIQEVFAAAAAGLSGFRRDRPGDTFRGWLRGISRNQVLLHFRRNSGRPIAVGGTDALGRLQGVIDSSPEPGEEESAELSEVYRRALELVKGEFADRTWQAFWLTAVEGRLPAAVESELGMSSATVRQARSRVLRRLKQELGELVE